MEFERAGLSRTQVRRLTESGVLERISRGLYRRANDRRGEASDLAAAARIVPQGTVCLLSALRFHGLTTQNPFEIWVAISRKAWRPRTSHPPLRFVHLSGPSLVEGIEDHRVDGVDVRVFSAAKTVADCFKFRNKIGIDVAFEARRDYRRLHGKRLAALWRFAEVDGVSAVIRPYLEALE